jgi:hypothetical protein
VPDFLSGFDKVAERTSYAPVPALDLAVPCSPTFTSQSFDDFHRLLGQNLSPVLSYKNETSPVSCNGMPVLPLPAPAAAHFQAPDSMTMMRQSNHQAHQPSIYYATPAAAAAAPQGTNTMMNSFNQNHSNLLSNAYSEALSAESNIDVSNADADAYNIFAEQSAFAAAQHSAYYMNNKSRKRPIQETQPSSVLGGQPLSTTSSRGFTASQPPSAYNRSHHGIGPMSIVGNPTNVVSETSNSTSEESTTGASSENLDTDECDSETSSRKTSCISDTESSARGNHRVLSNEQQTFFSY